MQKGWGGYFLVGVMVANSARKREGKATAGYPVEYIVINFIYYKAIRINNIYYLSI
jgi:hypothetical protein